MAFSDYETEQLRKALLKETRRCAITLRGLILTRSRSGSYTRRC